MPHFTTKLEFEQTISAEMEVEYHVNADGEIEIDGKTLVGDVLAWFGEWGFKVSDFDETCNAHQVMECEITKHLGNCDLEAEAARDWEDNRELYEEEAA